MITQRNNLYESLPQYGWEIKNVENYLRGHAASDWFIDEIWENEVCLPLNSGCEERQQEFFRQLSDLRIAEIN